MTAKDFFSFKKNRFLWGNLLAMVITACLLIFIVLKMLDSYTRHGQAIIVPDTKGMSVFQAEELFRTKGLYCTVADSIYVKGKPAGTVIDHIPAGGRKVKDGRTVYLTINTLNVPMQPAPDVADNSSLRQAQARILASGFKLTANELIRGEKDWVYEVKYNGRALEPGEKVPVGSTLTLVVGDGSGGVPESDDRTDDSTDESDL
ncbi:MAG: PASTA domain-containing protein [Mediterranea sp.]|jgi:beta-lactam-binding protein with PASTA domain|nr:PASTA domain-containing protein [Mediterranea sp.]